MKLVLNGLSMQIFDEVGNKFYVGQVVITELSYLTTEQKRRLLETAFAKLTTEEIQAILTLKDK